MEARLQVFAGSSSQKLGEEIAEYLGVPLGRATLGEFEDGETRVRLDEHVRGSDVFLVQSLCTPVDHHIMEMLLLADAVHRCSASRVTAVIPYMAYAKQEKKTNGGREPISAKLLANMISSAGVDRVLTIDLHSPAIEGFFEIPVDHLRMASILANHFSKLYLDDVVVVAPDSGGVARANEFRERLGASLAIIYRQGPDRLSGNALEMIGDVEGKTAIIVDDRISSGHTLLTTADALKERGASAVYACATHGLFARDALNAIAASSIESVVVTNTLPVAGGAANGKVEVLDIAPVIAESILRVHKDISMSSLLG